MINDPKPADAVKPDPWGPPSAQPPAAPITDPVAGTPLTDAELAALNIESPADEAAEEAAEKPYDGPLTGPPPGIVDPAAVAEHEGHLQAARDRQAAASPDVRGGPPAAVPVLVATDHVHPNDHAHDASGKVIGSPTTGLPAALPVAAVDTTGNVPA
jgi:hypothetical protein